MASQDFFLSPDEAQTMGNINFMRKSVRVRHTFPKTLKNPDGFEVVKEISSSEDRSITSFDRSSNSNPASSSISQSTSGSSSFNAVPSSPKPRPQNTSMDMFRNMARSIGKR